MSRGKPVIDEPARTKQRTSSGAKARSSKQGVPRTAAAKVSPSRKRSQREPAPSAPAPEPGPMKLAKVATAVATSRRENARAMLEAGRMSVAGVRALLERRVETLRETLAELRLVGKLMHHAGARESVAHVDELARGVLQLALSGERELKGMATSTQGDAP